MSESTDAGKDFFLTFAAPFKFFMAVWATCLCLNVNTFLIAAFPVRTCKYLSMLLPLLILSGCSSQDVVNTADFNLQELIQWVAFLWRLDKFIFLRLFLKGCCRLTLCCVLLFLLNNLLLYKNRVYRLFFYTL